MFLGFIIICQFLNNNKIILPSNRKLIVNGGEGPPVVFSSGLMNIVPTSFYSSLFRDIQQQKFTILTIHDWRPMKRKDVEEIANALDVTQVGFLSHSLFDPEILESTRIKFGVFCDPINIPSLRKYDVQFNVRFIKAKKLYFGKIYFPKFLDPSLTCDVETIVYKNVGHTDILNDPYASFSRWTKWWDTADPIRVNFHDWKYADRFADIDRITYRKFIARLLHNITLPSKDSNQIPPRVH